MVIRHPDASRSTSTLRPLLLADERLTPPAEEADEAETALCADPPAERVEDVAPCPSSGTSRTLVVPSA
jgi:hypothetical protein